MKKNLTSLKDFIDEEIGVKKTQKRVKFDAGFEAFKLAVIVLLAKNPERKGQ
jgi:hypothetical protein